MTHEQMLTQYGFQNVSHIIAAAKATNTPLWVAAALFEKESMGRNIYGHDAGGVFSVAGKNIEVTEANFREFISKINAGATSNGVGPSQITWKGFFPDAANKGFKLWLPLDNMIYGLQLLKSYLKGNYSEASLKAAGTRYNGKEIYGTDFVKKALVWKNKLSTTPGGTTMAKIYLSPSTQTHNVYAGTTPRFTERDDDEMHWMQLLRDVVKRHLEAAGHSVATHNYTEKLGQQMADANNWGADWYVALHSNATGGKAPARGMEVYAHAPGGKGEKLARAIYKRLEPVTPTGDRGVKFYNFAELRRTNMPAVLIELDFHDNTGGADWIRGNLEVAGRAIAQGICDMAGGTVGSTPPPVTPPPVTPPPVTHPSTSFTVRVKADSLNIRTGPGTNYSTNGAINDKGVYTIVAVQGDWGKLKSGAGWIHLGYTTRGTTAPARKSNETLAGEVERGLWGNGDDRKRRLTAAGYNYDAVQAIVNRRA